MEGWLWLISRDIKCTILGESITVGMTEWIGMTGTIELVFSANGVHHKGLGDDISFAKVSTDGCGYIPTPAPVIINKTGIPTGVLIVIILVIILMVIISCIFFIQRRKRQLKIRSFGSMVPTNLPDDPDSTNETTREDNQPDYQSSTDGMSVVSIHSTVPTVSLNSSTSNSYSTSGMTIPSIPENGSTISYTQGIVTAQMKAPQTQTQSPTTTAQMKIPQTRSSTTSPQMKTPQTQTQSPTTTAHMKTPQTQTQSPTTTVQMKTPQMKTQSPTTITQMKVPHPHPTTINLLAMQSRYHTTTTTPSHPTK